MREKSSHSYCVIVFQFDAVESCHTYSVNLVIVTMAILSPREGGREGGSEGVREGGKEGGRELISSILSSL